MSDGTILISKALSISGFVHLRVHYKIFSIELYTPGNLFSWSTHISYIFKEHGTHYNPWVYNYLGTATHLRAFYDLLRMLYLPFSSKAPGRRKVRNRMIKVSGYESRDLSFSPLELMWRASSSWQCLKWEFDLLSQGNG